MPTRRLNLASLVRHCAAATLFPCATLLPAAGPAENPALPAPPDYIVFVGADIMVEYRGQPHRVIGASRGAVEIRTGSTSEQVPLRAIDAMRPVRGTRLGVLQATIAKLRVTSMRVARNREITQFELDAASAIREDERRVELAQADLLIAQTAMRGSAPNAEARQQAITEASNRIENLRDVVDDYVVKKPAESESEAERQLAEVGDATGSRAPAPDLPFAYEHDPFGDGLNLRCEISSPQPLADAFLAVTIFYYDPREPDRGRQRTVLLPVGDVGRKPRKAAGSIPGLPLSFRLVACHLHLYGNGQEIATNLSPEARGMTADEVYAHFLGEYLQRQRDATRPPAPMLLAPAGDLRRHVAPAVLEQPIHALVDAQGGVRLSLDEAGATAVPASVSDVMRHVRFFPALENGVPVDGRIRFKLAVLLQ